MRRPSPRREIERESALREIRQKFPENVHYDLQQEREATALAESTAALPAASAPAAEAETEAATAPGKPSNGEPNPA